MAEEEPKKVTETVNNVSEPSPSLPAPAEKAVAAPQEKPVAPPPPASVEEKREDSKALVPIVASNFLNKIY